MSERHRRTDKSTTPLAQVRAEKPATVVRRFVADAQAYCELIENHRRVGKAQFRRDCAVLLGRLFAGAIQLPTGKRDDDIFDRRMKIFNAIQIDSCQLIIDMVKKTHRRGPTPKPWHPIVHKWRRAASRDVGRLDPAIRADPLFDTDISHEAWDEKCESLQKYFGDLDPYWIVFCPYDREGAIRSSLAYGLADIWRDLKEGLLVYAKGSKKARQHAIWMWTFHFHVHWAHHLVLVLNPLAWVISDEFNDR